MAQPARGQQLIMALSSGRLVAAGAAMVLVHDDARLVAAARDGRMLQHVGR